MSSLAVPFVCKTKYESGTLVVFDGKNGEVSASKKSHDPKVAGVTTDLDNAEVMLADFGDNPHRPVAVSGRVYCYVRGPIEYGDCIVTSDKEGIGQKLDNTKYVPGCVIGKSLGALSNNIIDLIEIVVITS